MYARNRDIAIPETERDGTDRPFDMISTGVANAVRLLIHDPDTTARPVANLGTGGHTSGVCTGARTCSPPDDSPGVNQSDTTLPFVSRLALNISASANSSRSCPEHVSSTSSPRDVTPTLMLTGQPLDPASTDTPAAMRSSRARASARPISGRSSANSCLLYTS